MKTVNEVLAALRQAKPDGRVYFSFGRCIPTTVDSWRGVYAEPALGWKPAGYSGHVEQGDYPTAAVLIERLERAISGDTFTGWKGGEFTYVGDERLHVDNPGDCTHTEIVTIEINEYETVLHTATEDSM